MTGISLDRAANALAAPEHVVQLVVIVASTRPGRFAPTVADWFLRCTEERQDADVSVLDLATTDFPGVHLTEQVEAADGFVVVTPEYNHSFPGPLKTAIDGVRAEWAAKPVAFVSYGGVSGGLRAVEALRLVFAELHATTVRDTVSFPMVRDRFDADGNPVDAEAATRAATLLLDRLVWWSQALRTARQAVPYG